MVQRTVVLVMALFLSVTVMAQSPSITGVVVDGQTGESLVGVYVVNKALSKSVSTDAQGAFVLKQADGVSELEFSYIGYQTLVLKVANPNMGTIKMEPEAVELENVVITGSIAVRRKTPVAISIIEPIEIQTRLGTQEFPELLNSTPGVYATKQGGGFGDARVNIRGFSSENVAVMINGIPVNDMEWGGVYWSNWAGLSDVTRNMQVQRGLGAAKVAAPSVGGSINIVTKSAESQRGGGVYYGMGNDGYNKIAFNASTGMTNSGWVVTMLGSKTWGDGFVQGTNFESYAYFLNLTRVINERHHISFMVFGATQWHNQRNSSDKLLISEWAKQPVNDRYIFNPGYGYDGTGQQRTFNRNFYHKPLFSINHFWTISRESSLSTSVYASLGTGGGTSGLGSNTYRPEAFGASNGMVNTLFRNLDGTRDFQSIMQRNHDSANGTVLGIQAANNNHNWYGVISSYSNQLANNVSLMAGIDLRYYKGMHNTTIQDLLGGAYFVDPQRAIDGKNKNDMAWKNEQLTVGDIVYRNYDGYVTQEGVFAQVEYTPLEKLNVFANAAANVNSFWRVEKFTADNQRSATVNKFGYNVKGGANYNLDENHNVFANIGYISRVPFFTAGIFLDPLQRSNAINKAGVNEKVFSAELGYGFRSAIFSANANVYRTAWNDKAMVKAVDPNDPERGTINLSGVDALHQGVEVDFLLRPIDKLKISGMVSLGDWTWVNDASGYVYNGDGQPVDQKGNVVPEGSPKQGFVVMKLDGIKVGNSAQTTAALDVDYELVKQLWLGLNYQYFGRNYADYKINVNWGDNTFVQPWEIPAANVFNARISYGFNMGKLDARLVGNVSNLFDTVYITDALDGGTGTWDKAQVFYGFGRTWSVGLKVSF